MSNKHYYEGLSGGLFLVGLGVILLVPGLGIWPWILAVIGLSQLPASLAYKKGWFAWQGFVWLAGLAILFALNLIWPGILILAGLNMVMGGLLRDTSGSPFASPASGEEAQNENSADAQGQGSPDQDRPVPPPGQ